MNVNKNLQVGVLGSGAWGTAIAMVIAEKKINVDLWCFEEDVAQEMREKRINNRYLPDVELPASINIVSDLIQAASDKDMILIVTPSPFIIQTLKQILSIDNIIEGKTLIGVLAKGFVQTPKGIRLIIEAMEDYLPGSYKGNLVYISGPSHAEEAARHKITGLISASLNPKHSIQFRELLSGRKLLVFSSFDVIGVQVSAAVKNIVAIAFGMFDALKELSTSFGDNTESLLLAAGLNEIQLLGQALGSTHPETFTSIAGVGDLHVTCRSIYGRNRRFGREIILQKKLKKYNNIESLIEHIPEIGYFPEGIHAAKFVHELSEQYKLKLPICNGIFNILNKDSSPMNEVEKILKGITRGSGFDRLDKKEQTV